MIAAPKVKICGLRNASALDAAIGGGAAFVGFVFYPPSPRHVTPNDAGALVARLPERVKSVAVMVDPDDALIGAVMAAGPVSMLQLHGKESPERTAAIRARFDVPIMKAIAVSSADDVAVAERYLAVADWLLFDAKPPKRAGALPGGNRHAFDWTLMAGRTWSLPWMLSGGLDTDNVAEAVQISGAAAVDVSSGVEQSSGVKDPALIQRFLDAARTPALPDPEGERD
ncbi:MAG: phosphoribosylanthranilate isomerase [Alphaproteobacteria bacterium]